MNVQAVCHSNLRFSHISCVCPGSTHDSYALYSTDLGKILLDGLKSQYFIAADEAYPLAGALISRYPGSQLGTFQESFNYYLSRCRVRIENAFALLVGKWGLLWKPLHIPLLKIPTMLIALGRLHNLGVDLDSDHADRNFALYKELSQGRLEFQSTLVTLPAFSDYVEIAGDKKTDARITREKMKEYLEEHGIMKPSYAIRERI